MPSCLVTGGAGFIGSHLATRLVEDGHAVRVIDNLSTGSRANIAHLAGRIEFIDGDVCDPRFVRLAVDGVDTVFHQSALASVPRSIEDPLRTHTACVTGTLALLNAARKAGVRRVVYAASCSAYGDQPELPKHELQAPSPLSPYAAAKLAGEHYLRAFANCFDIETVCLRYFNVFGPQQDPDSPYSAVIPQFVKALLTKERPVVHGDGTQSRDFTYVDNVVEANLLAARAEGISGKVYNIASGRSYSLLDLLSTLSQLLECPPCEPEFAPPRIGDVQHSWADISAARRDLGYDVTVNFHEGLRRTVEAYMAEERFHRAVALGH